MRVVGVENQVATQLAHETAGDGKAKAETLGEIVELEEMLEDVLTLGFRDARAVVFNGVADGSSSSGEQQAHRAVAGKLLGIEEQLAQRVIEHLAVGAHVKRVGQRRLDP